MGPILRAVTAATLLGTLCAAASHAAPPPAKPSAARLGSPKEEVASPLQSPVLPTCQESPDADADRALLRALLYAVEPAPMEIRLQAIEDLALLGDARALNFLGQLLFDAQAPIQLGALSAVTHFQTARAEEILSNVIRHPQLAEILKVRALEGLVLQRSPTAHELLSEVARLPRYSQRLQSTAKELLQGWGQRPGGASL